MQLRNYQNSAIESIYWYFKNCQGNPVLELPTGSGKSLVQADFVRGVVQNFPANRVLCLTHVKELIEQNYLELMGIWPEAPAGIYSAGLNCRDTDDPIIFASIQSVYNKPYDLGYFNLIIIDECHLVPVKTSEGMYRKFLDAMRSINPKIKVIGLSATPYRLDNGLLTEGDNRLFTDLISAKKIGATLPQLVEAGHLAPLTTPDEPLPQLSVEGVGKSGGEFKAGELNEAVKNQFSTTCRAVEEIVSRGANRKKWIIFATSIDHCDEVVGLLTLNHSISADVIHGQTNKTDRENIIARFKRGEVRALVSVNVLTTGFNVRDVDLLAMLRPTHSAALYIQMAGRGMRTAEGKTDCLVLDFAGNINRHGPVDKVQPPKKKGKREGDAPLKECESCLMLVPAGCRTCEFCGFEFPANQNDNLDKQASQLAIMGKAKPIKYEPTRMRFSRHIKEDRPDSLRVDYYEGIRKVASEWVCLFHQGRPLQNARLWWGNYVGAERPDNIFEAISMAERYAMLPEYIYIQRKGKFDEVVSKGNPVKTNNEALSI
jgi:DNA repair protein RadD